MQTIYPLGSYKLVMTPILRAIIGDFAVKISSVHTLVPKVCHNAVTATLLFKILPPESPY